MTLITTGMMVREGLAAADILRTEHRINTRVLQMATIKPLDHESIIKAARETGKILTVEEHTVLGGLGGAVAEVAAELGCAKVRRIGINDNFCGDGSPTCLLREEGLTVDSIVKEVINNLI